jgi:hypothetical protein
VKQSCYPPNTPVLACDHAVFVPLMPLVIKSFRSNRGILQVATIDPGHDPQRRFPKRYGLVVQRGSRQAQERTLAADAELGVVVIDQLAQFTGITGAETFF